MDQIRQQIVRNRIKTSSYQGAQNWIKFWLNKCTSEVLMIMEHLAVLYANAENTIDLMITQRELLGPLVTKNVEVVIDFVCAIHWCLRLKTCTSRRWSLCLSPAIDMPAPNCCSQLVCIDSQQVNKFINSDIVPYFVQKIKSLAFITSLVPLSNVKGRKVASRGTMCYRWLIKIRHTLKLWEFCPDAT